MEPTPRLLAVGHVTWDRTPGGQVLGGSVSYAAACVRRLGWRAAILTAAAADFVPARDIPGVEVFLRPALHTTRFENTYGEDGEREQWLLARSDDVALDPLPDEWRDPEVLLLAAVIGEARGGLLQAFEASTVGATAQGWLREVRPDGRVVPSPWVDAGRELAGVHALFLSEHDLPDAELWASEQLRHVPLIALTRGWRGLTLLTRDARHEIPSLPRQETDPTGAGDVFAAAFLVRYHETGDSLEAAAFAACAASCVVEGPGFSTLGDRREIEQRLTRRGRLIEEGEWDE
jgi:sugar/nucleoside kinase (ribokinase family)